MGKPGGHTPAGKETDIGGTASWPSWDSSNEEHGPYVRLVAANGPRHQDDGEGLPGVLAKPACTCEGTSTSMGVAFQAMVSVACGLCGTSSRSHAASFDQRLLQMDRGICCEVHYIHRGNAMSAFDVCLVWVARHSHVGQWALLCKRRV